MGKGNPRLIGWDGEKTLTFTVEDALISPVSFSMLSGAGIVKGLGDDTDTSGTKIYTHQVYDLVVSKHTTTSGTGNDQTTTTTYYAELPADVRDGATIVVSKEAPVYATTLDSAGAPKYFLSAISKDEIKTGAAGNYAAATGSNIFGDRGIIDLSSAANASKSIYFTLGVSGDLTSYTDTNLNGGETVRIDCYTVHGSGAQEIQIDAENFAGYYYIEADTLFRDEATGQDLPAQFVIPRGKIQSNFTFTMANSGDPSTFTFTIDAFPAFTKFNKRKKVMAALQIVDPITGGHNYANKTILGHSNRSGGKDIYGVGDGDTYTDSLYEKSVFDPVTTD